MRLTAALLALAASAATSAAPPANMRYVAMGSSFAAGTGIGGIKPETPQRCGRSALNYATLLADRLGLALDDQTCGGATTEHILGSWDELPAQIEAVNAETRLVTLTIGGNDLRYVFNLYAASCPAEGFAVQGATRPCPQPSPPAAEDFVKLEANLRKIAREVRAHAPQARLVFVQYVRLVPDTPCPTLELSAEGVMLNRSIGERLARVTMRVAREEGAYVLAADQLSRDHTACDAEPWSAGAKPQGPLANAPWHPNAAGHKAIADALAARLEGR